MDKRNVIRNYIESLPYGRRITEQIKLKIDDIYQAFNDPVTEELNIK